MKKAPAKMKKAAMKMAKKSPAKKALVGNQDKLPENLKKEILAATKRRLSALLILAILAAGKHVLRVPPPFCFFFIGLFF